MGNYKSFRILRNHNEDDMSDMKNNIYNFCSVSPSEYVNDKWTENISWESFSTSLEKILNQTINRIQTQHEQSNIYFLDIGSGPANITKYISTYFDYFMTLEPNPFYYQHYKHDTFQSTNGKYLGNINKFIQNVDYDSDFKQHHFDLITCIHMFYYIEIKDYQTVLYKLYKLLNKNGGTLIISMAPKYNDTDSDWSKLMHHFIGHYFDPLHLIQSICSQFDGATVDIIDEESSYNNTYVSVSDAVDNVLWNLMEELSFARKQHKCIQDKATATHMLTEYLTKNCVNSMNGSCTVTATVGHIVIINQSLQ